MGLLLGMLFFLLSASLAACLALLRAARRRRKQKPLFWRLAALSAFFAGLALCSLQWMRDLLSFF